MQNRTKVFKRKRFNYNWKRLHLLNLVFDLLAMKSQKEEDMNWVNVTKRKRFPKKIPNEWRET